MSWGEWLLIGFLLVVTVTGAACLLLSINDSFDVEDRQ